MRDARFPGRLCCAWLAAAGTLAAASLANERLGLEGVGFLGLALLPWLALAGLPADACRGGGPGPLREAALWLGACLPLLALGARLDLIASAPPRDVGAAALGGALSIAALAGARARAARARAGAAVHAVLWLGLVLGVPALAAIRSTGDGTSRGLELAAAASPLGWALELARAGGVAPASSALAPVLVALALAAVAAFPWPVRAAQAEPA